MPAVPSDDYLERNLAAWEKWAPWHVAAGRRAWHDDELRWGIWQVPESELQLLEGFKPGDDAIELGCGTAAISAWLARRKMHPVAVDFAQLQLETAETLQYEFGLRFPLVRANAEQIRFESDSFDLAISEYGASLWCDPRRWLAEAHRLLRPEGRLVFVTNSPLLITCTPTTGGTAADRLMRQHFSRYRVEFDEAVEFHLSHGHWVQLLRATGFAIENLIEVRPPTDAEPRLEFVTPEWAERWPSEDVWVAHKLA